MNKLFGFVFVIGALVLCAAGYFYVNPQHLPRAIGDQVRVPGFQVPAPKSPVGGFRPPQF
jgi:hypothetical protein